MSKDKIIKEEHVNDMGRWVVYEDLTMDLVEPSETWIALQTREPSPPEPTQDDFMLDLEFRVSMIEMGL